MRRVSDDHSRRLPPSPAVHVKLSASQTRCMHREALKTGDAFLSTGSGRQQAGRGLIGD